MSAVSARPTSTKEIKMKLGVEMAFVNSFSKRKVRTLLEVRGSLESARASQSGTVTLVIRLFGAKHRQTGTRAHFFAFLVHF